MKIGKHFTLDEMTASQIAARRGIKNEANAAQLQCLKALVEHILDPLREALGKPIIVSSGLRVPALNVATGGSSTSQHCLGQAVDISVPGVKPAQLFAKIRQLSLPFDQLIEEFDSWVHVSYGPRHRRQCLLARKFNGRTVYSPA
jgi:zinc D-Ala-D-Ala carboxypeptidase